MEETKGISLSELFNSLLKRWYIILTTILMGLILTGVLAFFIITPQYSSSAEVLVHVYKGNTDNPDILDTGRMLETVAYHFKSDIVLEDVIEELDLAKSGFSPKRINDNLSIRHLNSNFYIKITYTHPDNEFSRKLTQQIIDSAERVANDELSDMFGNIFSVTSNPKTGVYTSPNKLLFLVVGFLLGGIVGATIIFIIEFGKSTYKTKEEIERDLKLQVIGLIPEYDVMEKKK